MVTEKDLHDIPGTRKIKTTKSHPGPFFTFREGKMIPVSGETSLTPGDVIRVFYSDPDAEGYYVQRSDGSGPTEKWDWEDAVSFRRLDSKQLEEWDRGVQERLSR